MTQHSPYCIADWLIMSSIPLTKQNARLRTHYLNRRLRLKGACSKCSPDRENENASSATWLRKASHVFSPHQNRRDTFVVVWACLLASEHAWHQPRIHWRANLPLWTLRAADPTKRCKDNNCRTDINIGTLSDGWKIHTDEFLRPTHPCDNYLRHRRVDHG